MVSRRDKVEIGQSGTEASASEEAVGSEGASGALERLNVQENGGNAAARETEGRRRD